MVRFLSVSFKSCPYFSCSVKCLGTEGRVTDESKKVQANSAVIPFVTFPGQEIKDLYVHETAESAPAAPQKKPENRQNAKQQQQQYQQQPPRAPAQQERQPIKRERLPQNQPQHQQPHQQRQQQQNQSVPQQKREHQQQAPREQAPREARPSSAGTGAHLLHLREKKAPEGAPTPDKRDDTTVFDFQAGLNVFKKDEVLAKVATEDVAEAIKETKYKKDDFFDMLSSDQKARAEGKDTRMSATQERSLNQDTFGAIALQGGGGYRRHYGRGGGGGGRGGNNNYGGRGRGRGRGRATN